MAAVAGCRRCCDIAQQLLHDAFLLAIRKIIQKPLSDKRLGKGGVDNLLAVLRSILDGVEGLPMQGVQGRDVGHFDNVMCGCDVFE